MKLIYFKYHRRIAQVCFILAFGSMCGCSEDILTEKPLSFLNPEVFLINESGFESAIVSLHDAARSERFNISNIQNESMYLGTDIAVVGDPDQNVFNDYNTTLTPVFLGVDYFWEWAYLRMIPRANMIIDYADNPEMSWESEEKKNAVVAEARFFRGYTYNALVNIYGGVPIVDHFQTLPKVDFVRNTRPEVLEFVKADLEFASQWLPEVQQQEGRIVKAAADHLLTEVNISLELFDEAIESATRVISSGRYRLMTERFGNYKDAPGDVFWDLFRDGNQNRSSGNEESIWVIQIEFQTPGGAPVAGGNTFIRSWGPRYFDLRDPDNNNGMILTDSLGRGVGWVKPSNYFLYHIWQNSDNDIRNSNFNIRRKWIYNNPESAYFGQVVEPRTTEIDTIYRLYPSITKIEGEALAGPAAGRTFKDLMVFRLAETYLLRAEAYWRKGDLNNAAADINVVRARAGAMPATPDMIDLDFILDERARELTIEEPRRRTLVRTGTLLERVRKYNDKASTRNSIQDHHRLFPIPLKAIDANIGGGLTQNPGYN